MRLRHCSSPANSPRLRSPLLTLATPQARGDVDAKRARLAKLRGTPGVREERVAEAERDLGDAQQRAEAAKATYEVGPVWLRD